LCCFNCWVYFIATLFHYTSSDALYKETYNYGSSLIDLEPTNSMGVEPEICEPLEIEQSNKQDLQISVDASFLSWDLAEVQLNSYAKAKECVSNQVVDLLRQRNRSSGKISCPWHINLSKPKESAVVIITSIIGEHNYQLQSDIGLYAPKYRKLLSEILEKIEFYITKGKIGSKQILPLLTSEFSDHIIHKRNLYNAVQKVRRPLNQRQGKAQEFVDYLFMFEEDFNRRWLRLLNKYSQIQNYFNRTLQGTGIQSTQRVEVMNRLIKDGIRYTLSLRSLHEHIQNLLDNEAHQMLSVVESLFLQVSNILKLYLTPYILAIQLQQIAGSLLYRARLRPMEDILELQENLQLDYDSGFLENQLDRPQNSIIALIKDINLSDIIEIWKLIYLSSQDIRLEDLQPQSIKISTMFQQTATNIAVPDFYIIEKIRDTNIYIIKNQQVANKKARYANGFGRMKKALIIALELGYEEELIYIMSSFINQKKSAIENIDNENIQPSESQQIIVMDPLVVKHHGRPPIKRLKSFSESYDHKKLVHDTTNLQDPNLEMPPSNIDLNSYVIDNNANKLCHEGKRKYVCNLCGGVGHNSCTCKKQE
ncbi:6837_t:CDS:2, partial [Dentiscutata heterogama]